MPEQPQHEKSKRERLPERRSRERRARLIRAFILVICMAAMFAAGFVLRSNDAFLARIGMSTTTSDTQVNPGATVHGSTYTSISARIAEVEGLLSNDGLDTYDLDAMTTSLMEALCKATDDSYMRYYDASRYEAYVRENANSGYGGIGVLFSEYNGKAYAVDVFTDGVAQLAGVQEGDFVVAIDGDRSQEWTSTEVINALSRQEGEQVVITWRRPATLEAEGGSEFTTTLEISKSMVTNVTSAVSGTVGYIRVRQFNQNSSDLVKKAISDLTSSGATSFVLDIRDCPGGYLTQAVDIAGLFMKSGVVVQVKTKETTTTKSTSGVVSTTLPLVVLVNGKTSSAAEVLAAALQDSDRATVVGTTTQGKGSVQITQSLSFGGALRYTVAEYLSPLGHAINDAGVSPDISVAATDDSGSNQLDLALETAASLAAA